MRTTTMRATSRRRWLPAVLAGVVAAVVGLACGVLPASNGQPPQAPTTAPAPPAGDAPPTAPGSPQQAGSPRDDFSGPSAGPVAGDVSFVEVAGVRLPVSGTSGPYDSSGGLARGFARTGPGAALAAVHILLRIHPEVGADVFGPTLAGQVVGEDAGALAANVQEGYEQLLLQWPVAYGEPAGQLSLTIPGFRVDSFTDQEAVVVLLFEVPRHGRDSLLGATTVRMRWHSGDWAMRAPGGGAFTETSLIDDQGGFTLWGSA